MKKARKGKIGVVAALAAALSCCSLIAVSQLCFNGEEVLPVSAETTTATNVSARSMSNADIAEAWSTAVQNSLDSTDGAPVTFQLQDDWTAEADTEYTTSFGSNDEVGFSNGRIYVPEGANIVLDLNGYTIDRNLTGDGVAAVANGGVIYVEGGTLEITDTSADADGKITGGNTTGSGGGVYVYPGTLTMTGGTISDNTASSYGGGVYGYGTSSSEFIFNMTGGEISGNTAKYGGGVYTGSYSSFTMSGGEISGNTASSYGGGVRVNSTMFTMSGGTISGNKASSYGGGVYQGNGTFEMTGGEISGNTSNSSGGGVFVSGSAASFTMSGGEIGGNTATISGGGVYVYSSATFTMNGGTISGNKSNATSGYGGGVYISSGTFNMNGGTITGNTATTNGGGVFVSSTFYVTGGVIIGNTLTDGTTNNVYLGSTSRYINIAGKLASNTYIGIANTAARAVTIGYTTSLNKVANAANYFVSDNTGFEISNDGTEVTLAATTATAPAKTVIDWSYKAYDSNGGNPQTVTVDSGAMTGSATYTGGAFVFDAVSSGLATVIDGSGRAATPINVGTYYVSAKTNKQNYTNPVFTFEILPADISTLGLTVNADNATYTGSAIETSVRVAYGAVLLTAGTDYTVSYKNNVNAGTATAVITATGNYTGTIEQTFTIEKAKLGVRWGLDTATYTGAALSIPVYAEGLLGSDKVTLTVTYTQDGAVVTPKEVGRYVAKVSLDSANYALSSTYEIYFYIVEKKIDAIWENTSFIYDGTEKTLTAYFMNGGDKVELTVTLEETTDAGTYKATAKLPAGYENFALTDNTATVTYVIEKAEVEAVWGTYEFKYDGNAKQVEVTLTGLNGEDLTGGLTYTYYDEDGNKVSPVGAGVYTVVIELENDNYKLTGKTEESFSIAKQKLVVTLDETYDGEYDGNGKTPLASVTDEDGNGVDYVVTYALVDESGNVLKDLGKTLPVDAGKYVLTVAPDNANVEQTVHTEAFEITAKTVTVSWNFGDNAMEINGVYTYLYDGTAHQPEATAEGVELTVTGTGKNVRTGYTATVSCDNPNYILDGTLSVTFNVIQSKVSKVRWYEYGSDTPVAAGVIPSYEYIFVYGQEEGAKLSAYGVISAADDSLNWSVSGECLVKLNVTYNTYYDGFWAIGTYTATASLSSADKVNDSCYMPLGLKDTLDFEVTAITHSANVAEIKWVVVNEDGTHTVLTENDKFIYNGSAQAPVAIRILNNTYNVNNPEEGINFEFLKTGGQQTDAGTYYAYIIPEGNYEIKDADIECKFVIAPLEVEIEWKDAVDGKITVTYNGKERAPEVSVTDNEDCTVTVESFVRAGTYTVTANVGNNYTVKGDGTVTFVIEQFVISTDQVVWESDGEKRTDVDGSKYFVWKYDGYTHTPTATLKVKLEEDGDEIELKLTVTGSAQDAGTHYAYATLDSRESGNEDFVMEVARIRLDIVQNSVTAIWDDEENNEIIYSYDGKPHSPTAYYMVGEQRIELHVVGSGTEAGTYVAFIVDDLDISNGATKEFTIEARKLNVAWDKTKVSYTGELRAPSVTFTDAETEDAVTLKLGVDYTVSGYINAGEYVSEITLINGNYTVADGATHSFTITKQNVVLTWYGKDGGTSEEDFIWVYDEDEHAPTFKASVEALDELIVVKGAETQIGVYTAVALLDNANYTISNPKKEFSIVGKEITVIWTDENGEELEKFEWEFDVDGAARAPYAYYLVGEEKIALDVVGAGIYAGTYKAKAILPAGFGWANGEDGECEFTITPRIIQGIVWKGVNGSEENFEFTYNGTAQVPTAEMLRDGTSITVTGAAINKGVYKAVAILADDKNYAFADDVEVEKEFVILAKTVNVTWYGEDDSLTDFAWAYDSKVHAPTAWATEFKDGELVKLFEIPVIGGTSSGGQHTATLMDVFDNYDFVAEKLDQPFSITEIYISVSWENAPEADDNGVITFTYTYTGKAISPVAVAKDGNTPVDLTYLIKNGDKAENAIINAGTYTVTVSPSDKNYKITEGVTTVTVVVKPLEVEVVWGETELVYNGSVQAPKAWFVYGEGDDEVTITLTVEGAEKEVCGEDESYTATAISGSANFVLKDGTATKDFVIVEDEAEEYVWVWGEDGQGSWVAVKAETDPDESEGDNAGGDTPDPEPTDPEPTDPTNPEGGEGTDPDENEGSTPEGGNESGTTPSEPENLGTDPAGGDNTTTDPNEGNKNEGDGADEGDDDNN